MRFEASDHTEVEEEPAASAAGVPAATPAAVARGGRS